MTLPPLEDCAARLFEAGRTEVPPEGAPERAIAAAKAARSKPSGNVVFLRRGLRGVIALTALAAAAALIVLGQDGDRWFDIRAERLEPRSSSEAAPAVAPGSDAEPGPATSSSTRGAPAVSAPKPRRPATGKPEATLGDELEQLNRARTALASRDVQGALTVLNQYDNVLRGHRLRAEAMVLRMEALRAGGDADRAARLAEQFVKDNPTNPLVDRARSFMMDASVATSPE